MKQKSRQNNTSLVCMLYFDKRSKASIAFLISRRGMLYKCAICCTSAHAVQVYVQYAVQLHNMLYNMSMYKVYNMSMYTKCYSCYKSKGVKSVVNTPCFFQYRGHIFKVQGFHQNFSSNAPVTFWLFYQSRKSFMNHFKKKCSSFIFSQGVILFY